METSVDRGSITIAMDECKGCGLCIAACPPHVLQASVELNRYGYHTIEYLGSGCTGCGICYYVCPEPGALTVWRREAA